VNCAELAGFSYIEACVGGSPSGEADKIGSSKNELNLLVNRGIYVPTWDFNSWVN
jgi:hypothetical protein